MSAAPKTIANAAPGSRVTFTLTGWSSADGPPWALGVARADGSDFAPGQLSPRLSVDALGNGETATLELTVPVTARSAQFGGINVLSGPEARAWPVAFVVE